MALRRGGPLTLLAEAVVELTVNLVLCLVWCMSLANIDLVTAEW